MYCKLGFYYNPRLDTVRENKNKVPKPSMQEVFFSIRNYINVPALIRKEEEGLDN